ncbi:hypothetical protein DFH27DRAFT_526406 [Peziza echinospora]|nr:hypothetical protein DFH27DRAFT_526406 [Peziza echinospora]
MVHLLPSTRPLVYSQYLPSTTTSSAQFQARGPSPSRRAVSPGMRTHEGQSTDGGADLSASGTMNGAPGWPQNGRKFDTRRNNSAVSRSNGSIGAQEKKEVPQQARRPTQNKRSGSSQSTLSASLPSTPNHQARQIANKSRSPSPHASLLDSPKSAASEPIVTSQKHTPAPLHKPCPYETLLSTVRRRFMYSIGDGYLPRETPVKEKLNPADDSKLTADMLVLFDELKPSDESNERRHKLVIKLERLLNQTWPGHDFKVLPFGSSENKLCTTESDIDVCIITKVKDGASQTCAIAKTLQDNGMDRVVCVPAAKVPIVKIWDPELEIACDMNVNNTVALENTRMIKTYVEIDSRVRPLAMVLKHWAKQRLLNDALGATLGSYTWLCLILNYLQTRNPPILPSLHQRPHPIRPPVQGVDCSFDDDLDGLKGFGDANKESLGSLLFGFFRFYGYEVDYEKSVMSVRLGKVISKDEKGWCFGHNNYICVEEPFNTFRNLSNTCDAYSAKGLHMEFRRGYKILAEALDLDALCEHYEFPPEEPSSFVPPPTQPKPTLTRGNPPPPQPYRGRGNHSGGGRGSRYSNSTPKQSQYRRPNNQSNYTQFQQPQYFSMPELYMLQSAQQMYPADSMSLMAQMQAQTVLVANYMHAQAQAHAQLQAQMQNQQNGTHNTGQATDNAHGYSRLENFARLLEYPLYYSPLTHPSDTAATPVSPPSTPSASDARNHMGRGRLNGSYTPRSRSQTPREPSVARYGSSNLAPSGRHEEDELDYGDHSSNGSSGFNNFRPPPPETPPEEETTEIYVGYFIGDSLQEGLGPAPPSLVEEEPFVEQKYIVDRQKRLSQEKLPTPLLRKSRPPSPHAPESEQFGPETPVSAIRMKKAREHHYDDRGGPLIVNGSTAQSPVYAENPFAHAGLGSNTSSPDVYAYGHPFEVPTPLAARYYHSKGPDNSLPSDDGSSLSRQASRLSQSPTSAQGHPYMGLSPSNTDYMTGHRLPKNFRPHVISPNGYSDHLDPVYTNGHNTSVGDMRMHGTPISDVGNLPLARNDMISPNSAAIDQASGQQKASQTGDKHPTNQNGPQKKQGRKNSSGNIQSRRKTSKPHASQAAPVVAVSVEAIPDTPAKTAPKEGSKSRWSKPKPSKGAKKQGIISSPERKEVMVEGGERKGG